MIEDPQLAADIYGMFSDHIWTVHRTEKFTIVGLDLLGAKVAAQVGVNLHKPSSLTQTYVTIRASAGRDNFRGEIGIERTNRAGNYSLDKYQNELTFIRPFFWTNAPEKFQIWKEAMQDSLTVQRKGKPFS